MAAVQVESGSLSLKDLTTDMTYAVIPGESLYIVRKEDGFKSKYRKSNNKVPQCVVVPHKHVTSVHARISYKSEDGLFYVKDLKSSNGTVVTKTDGSTILVHKQPNRTASLEQGDVINIAEVRDFEVVSMLEGVPETARVPETKTLSTSVNRSTLTFHNKCVAVVFTLFNAQGEPVGCEYEVGEECDVTIGRYDPEAASSTTTIQPPFFVGATNKPLTKPLRQVKFDLPAGGANANRVSRKHCMVSVNHRSQQVNASETTESEVEPLQLKVSPIGGNKVYHLLERDVPNTDDSTSVTQADQWREVHRGTFSLVYPGDYLRLSDVYYVKLSTREVAPAREPPRVVAASATHLHLSWLDASPHYGARYAVEFKDDGEGTDSFVMVGSFGEEDYEVEEGWKILYYGPDTEFVRSGLAPGHTFTARLKILTNGDMYNSEERTYSTLPLSVSGTTATPRGYDTVAVSSPDVTLSAVWEQCRDVADHADSKVYLGVLTLDVSAEPAVMKLTTMHADDSGELSSDEPAAPAGTTPTNNATLSDVITAKYETFKAKICTIPTVPGLVTCKGLSLQPKDATSANARVFSEYVPQPTVHVAVVADGKFAEDEASRCTRDVLESLCLLHDVGITHRLIKPTNIFMRDESNENSKYKLADWASFTLFGDGERDRSADYSYRAPETMNNFAASEPAIDVWALGCVVVWLVTGEQPLKDLIQRGTSLLNLKADPDVSGYDVSDECRDFLGQCLQLDAAKRPSVEVLLNHAWVKETAGKGKGASE